MTTVGSTAPVVVGVDGYENAAEAALWAADLAARMKVGLEVCYATPELGYYFADVAIVDQQQATVRMRRAANAIVASVTAEIQDRFPALDVVGRVISGPIGSSIIDAGAHAQVIVLGSGAELLGFHLIGSTTSRVASNATVPVLVRRGEPAPDAPIVVGVDGTPASGIALESAFALADLYGVGVVAAHTWTPQLPVGDVTIPLLIDVDELERRHRRLLDDAIGTVAPRYPAVPVTPVLAQGNPAKVLIGLAAEHNTQLVVVGNRGRGRLAGAILGSTSMNVLHHARCSILVCHAAP